MSIEPFEERSELAKQRLSLLTRRPWVQAVLQGLMAGAVATLPPPYGAPIGSCVAALNAYSTQRDLNRLQTLIIELTEQVDTLSRAGVAFLTWDNDDARVEWFMDRLDDVRRVRGYERLHFLGALMAGVLRDDSEPEQRILDEHVWEIAAELSNTELALLREVWNVSIRQDSSSPGLVRVHQLGAPFSDTPGLTWTYLARLEGLGLIVSPVRSSGESDDLPGYTPVTLDFSAPAFLLTKMGLALFDLGSRGGWTPDTASR